LKAKQAAAVQNQNLAKANTDGRNDGVQSANPVQPQRNLNVQGSSVEPEVIQEAAVVKNAEPKPAAVAKAEPVPFPKGAATSQPAPEVQVNIKGTSMDPDAKPVPAKTQPAQPKFENDGYSKPAPVVTEQAIVAKKEEAPKPAPEVPEQFRLPADVSWGNAPATEAPVRNAPPQPSQLKDNPAPLSNHAGHLWPH